MSHFSAVANLAILFANVVLLPPIHAQQNVVAASVATAPDPLKSQSSLFGFLNWRLAGPFRGGWSEMTVGVPQQPDTFYFGAAGGGVLSITHNFLVNIREVC